MRCPGRPQIEKTGHQASQLLKAVTIFSHTGAFRSAKMHFFSFPADIRPHFFQFKTFSGHPECGIYLAVSIPIGHFDPDPKGKLSRTPLCQTFECPSLQNT
jgi:hypothetical protein